MIYRFLHILILFQFISCNSNSHSNQTELSGVFCNRIHHCIYFDKHYCVIDRAKIEEFKILPNQIIQLQNKDDPNKYCFELIDSLLRIREFEDCHFREFQRIPYLNDEVIVSLYFSSVTEFSDLELAITGKDKIQIRINYHDIFESGDYEGKLSQPLSDFINRLINGIELTVPSKLKKEIFSDTQEWGMKIYSDQDYSIYYNYENVKQTHNYLAFLLEGIPFFIKLEQSNTLHGLEDIKVFRENEFKRNLKEYGQ